LVSFSMSSLAMDAKPQNRIKARAEALWDAKISIILKLAQVRGYNKFKQIKLRNGEYMANTNVVTLMRYILSTGHAMVGLREFVDLLNEAGVEPHEIWNDHVKGMMTGDRLTRERPPPTQTPPNPPPAGVKRKRDDEDEAPVKRRRYEEVPQRMPSDPLDSDEDEPPPSRRMEEPSPSESEEDEPPPSRRLEEPSLGSDEDGSEEYDSESAESEDLFEPSAPIGLDSDEELPPPPPLQYNPIKSGRLQVAPIIWDKNVE
jgi:hypothetical protein